MSSTFFETYSPLLLADTPLGKYSAVGLGGKTDWLYIEKSSTDRLIKVLEAAWHDGIPTRILGGGANVLISDNGFRGLIVISRIAELQFNENTVTVTGGHGLTVLARKCAVRGISGLEWAASVPGTVGGATVNNAGAHGGDMSSSLISAEIFDATHGSVTLALDDLAYNYRNSSLKAREDKRFVVTQVQLKLTSDSPKTITSRMDDYLAYRKVTQPPGASLGSIFKNPPDDHAGRLIEACDLKGYAIGGAQVSPRHANFFINRDHGIATASDYHALITYVQETVYRQTGVLLETEIELVGEW
jgi:UDP-N-acetylmuramate dehydrogenase